MFEIDVPLFAQAAAGDENALTNLLSAYGSQIRRRLSISATWQATLDIDDVMQVTYMEAFLRIGQLQGHDEPTFVAWLTRIAQNNLRDAVSELEADRRPDPRMRVRPVSTEDRARWLTKHPTWAEG